MTLKERGLSRRDFLKASLALALGAAAGSKVYKPSVVGTEGTEGSDELGRFFETESDGVTYIVEDEWVPSEGENKGQIIPRTLEEVPEQVWDVRDSTFHFIRSFKGLGRLVSEVRINSGKGRIGFSQASSQPLKSELQIDSELFTAAGGDDLAKTLVHELLGHATEAENHGGINLLLKGAIGDASFSRVSEIDQKAWRMIYDNSPAYMISGPGIGTPEFKNYLTGCFLTEGDLSQAPPELLPESLEELKVKFRENPSLTLDRFPTPLADWLCSQRWYKPDFFQGLFPKSFDFSTLDNMFEYASDRLKEEGIAIAVSRFFSPESEGKKPIIWGEDTLFEGFSETDLGKMKNLLADKMKLILGSDIFANA